jgi:hypothetical protein
VEAAMGKDNGAEVVEVGKDAQQMVMDISWDGREFALESRHFSHWTYN